MKILALIILVFVGSNSFANLSCDLLFERTATSLHEINSVINELHSLRRNVLTSDSHKSRIANILYKQKIKELSHILSEQEIHAKLKEVKFDRQVVEDSRKEISAKEREINELIKVQEFLMEIGIPIDGKDATGRNPLHIAAIKNRADLILPLISFGAAINGKTNAYSTPLYYAAGYGRTEIAEILVRSGADIMAGSSPLGVAASGGKTEIVQLLCDAGACADKNDLDSPLYNAAINDHKEIVNILIKLGANVNHEPAPRISLLSLADVQKHKDIVEILKNAGAKE
jgi:hypothetical protein